MEDQHPDAVTQAHEQVLKLRQDLQAAELQEALVRKRTSICVVQPLKEEEDRGEPTLGPTIQATVKIEGNTVEALVDTGSPITIASIGHSGEALPISFLLPLVSR